MSGIAIVATAYSPPPPPTSSGPLSAWVNFAPSGGIAFNVSGASGDLSGQGYGIIQYDRSGGTPPFTESLTIQGDPSGKLNFDDNGLGATAVSYTGFGLNEVENGWIKYTVTDGTGTTVSARYPVTGMLSVTRTS